MNESDVGPFRKLLESELERLFDKFGMSVEVGSIRYDAVSVRMSVKGLEYGAKTDTESYYDIKHRLMPQIPPRMSVVEIKGTMYQVLGWKRKAPKRPIIMVDFEGKRWVWPVNALIKAEVHHYPPGTEPKDEKQEPINIIPKIKVIDYTDDFDGVEGVESGTLKKMV